MGTLTSMTIILSSWEDPGKVAIDAAWKARSAGADLRTTLEQGLAAAELDPLMVSIGLGSLPNSDGELELDASMMDGEDLSCGAVCAVRGIVPVISVARLVMEKTKHVMIAGEQARRFAIENGFKPRNLMTPEIARQFEAWRADPEKGDAGYIHSIDNHDTVTMLAWESPSHVVAASSTSGLGYKMPGRVGDSPIVGAGIYADNEIGCAGATGLGEELWKAAASFRAVELMRQGYEPQQACEEVTRQMIRRQKHSQDQPCVVFAMRNDGAFGASTTLETFPLWVCIDGVMELKTYSVPEF